MSRGYWRSCMTSNNNNNICVVVVVSRGRLLCCCLLWILLQQFVVTANSVVHLPKFIDEPQSAVVRSGDHVTLRCSTSPSDVTLTWQFNGGLVPARHRGSRIEAGTLYIESFSRLYEGVYQCVANSSVGSVVSRPAKLQQAAIGALNSSSVDRVVSVIDGSTVIIPCPSAGSGVPPATTEFTLNSTKLQVNDRHYILASGNLLIMRVSRHDVGNYRCLLINRVTGSRLTSPGSTTLSLTAPPTRESIPRLTHTSPTRVSVTVGQTLTLECTAEGWPIPSVKWFRYGGQLPHSRHRQHSGVLTIEHVDRLDEGTYVCDASNNIAHSPTNVIFVDVLFGPVIVSPPVDQIVVEDSSVTFQCLADGAPQVSVTWLHNAVLITPDTTTHVTGASVTLLRVMERSAGVYQCIVNNTVGVAVAAALLTVVKRGSVTNSSNNNRDSLLNAHVTVRWTTLSPRVRDQLAPAVNSQQQQQQRSRGTRGRKNNNGGGNGGSGKAEQTGGQQEQAVSATETDVYTPPRPVITSVQESSVSLLWSVLPPLGGLHVVFYKVQYKRVAGGSRREAGWQTVDEDIPRTKHTFEVTGLQPGGRYRFRLVAVYSNNDNKHGPNTRRVRLRTTSRRAKSPAVDLTIVAVEPLSSTSLQVSWQCIPTDRTLIDGFIVYYRRYEHSEYMEQRIADPDTRQTLLTNLNVDATYSVSIRSYNAFGRSEFSNTAVKKTHGPSDYINSSDIYSNGDEEILQPADFPPGVPSPVESSPGEVGHRKTDSKADGTPRVIALQDNHTLYVILAIVVGAICVGVVIALFICLHKHKQQRSLLAALQQKKCKPMSTTVSTPGYHDNWKHSTTPSHTHANGYTHSNGSCQPVSSWRQCIPVDSRCRSGVVPPSPCGVDTDTSDNQCHSNCSLLRRQCSHEAGNVEPSFYSSLDNISNQQQQQQQHVYTPSLPANQQRAVLTQTNQSLCLAEDSTDSVSNGSDPRVDVASDPRVRTDQCNRGSSGPVDVTGDPRVRTARDSQRAGTIGDSCCNNETVDDCVTGDLDLGTSDSIDRNLVQRTPSSCLPSTLLPSTLLPSTLLPSTLLPSTLLPSTLPPSDSTVRSQRLAIPESSV